MNTKGRVVHKLGPRRVPTAAQRPLQRSHHQHVMSPERLARWNMLHNNASLGPCSSCRRFVFKSSRSLMTPRPGSDRGLGSWKVVRSILTGASSDSTHWSSSCPYMPAVALIISNAHHRHYRYHRNCRAYTHRLMYKGSDSCWTTARTRAQSCST